MVHYLPSAKRRKGICVYKMTNLVTGDIYIGKFSRSCRIRMNEHVKCAWNMINRPLYSAMRKYSNDLFSVTILSEHQTSEDAYYAEQKYISMFCPKYNLTDGGLGLTGKKLSKHHQDRLYQGRLKSGMYDKFRGSKRDPEIIKKSIATKKKNGFSEKLVLASIKNFSLASKKNCKSVWCLETGQYWHGLRKCAQYFGKKNGAWLGYALDNPKRTFMGLHFVSHVG